MSIPLRKDEAMFSDERLIQVLASVNGTAIDNDSGRAGERLANVCHQAAERLKVLTAPPDDPDYLNKPADDIMPLSAEYGPNRFSYVDRPARTDELGTDEVGC